MGNNNGGKGWMRYAALGSTISVTLVGSVVCAWLLGSFLDRQFGTEPVLTVVLILLGVSLGLAFMIVTLYREFGGRE
jgi:F0F1-type ATP synthase assembly protein I